jgi:hypothetical protein
MGSCNDLLRSGSRANRSWFAVTPRPNIKELYISPIRKAHDMSDHVIVWDLETVPDIAGYAAANGLIGKLDEEIREALGNKFPKHIYHSIVCIGARRLWTASRS